MIRKIEDIKINKKNNDTNILPKKIILKEPKEYKDYEEPQFNKRLNKIKSSPAQNLSKKKIKNFKFFNLLTLILFLIIVYFICNFFEKTIIEINKKTEKMNLNNQQFQSELNNNDDISYEIMIENSEEDKEIELKNTKVVSTKSQGFITIYNEYGNLSQKISAGSYLTDDQGKLYLLDSSVIVPGYTLDKDKKIIPGKAKTSVTSFLPGDSYNGSPTSLTFNFFKNSPKFNKIYAKADSVFEGGAQGEVYYLDPENLGKLNSYAENTFKNNLIKKLKAELPAGYIFYDQGINFSYSINNDLYFKEALSKIPISGTLSAVIFKESNLEKNIIKRIYPKMADEEIKEIKIENINDLKLSFIDVDQIISKDLQNLNFYLNGDVDLIWNPNSILLANKLIGIHKDWTEDIFKKDPGIKNATVRIFPPWKSYLPKDVSKIKINIR